VLLSQVLSLISQNLFFITPVTETRINNAIKAIIQDFTTLSQTSSTLSKLISFKRNPYTAQDTTKNIIKDIKPQNQAVIISKREELFQTKFENTLDAISQHWNEI